MAHDPYPEEEEEDIHHDISTAPFTSHSAYGKGLWRHPIKFVAESSTTTLAQPPSKPPLSIADAYLAIVCPNGTSKPEPSYPTCPTCNEPIKEADSRAHYLSIAHQLALPRTPTPSAIDRSRMGLKYMEKHGFDVDARKGLGAAGEGMLYPIMPKEKIDKYGIGVQVGKDGKLKEKVKVKETLDAGKVRKKAEKDKKRDERLRKMFYEDEKVTKYLGELEGRVDAFQKQFGGL